MITQNAIITGFSIRMERGFVLDSWIQLDFGGSTQGFGGFALYLSKTAKHHKVESVAGHWLWRLLEIAGVEDTANLVGKTIRVRKEDEFDRITAIGHIINDDWFDPSAEFSSALGIENKELTSSEATS